MIRTTLTALCLLPVFAAQAQAQPSALNAKEFARHWTIESEAPDYRLTFAGDTADLVSPKGMTVWRRERMEGRTTIEYDAQVVVRRDGDRLSDLNCFWMATDPAAKDGSVFRRMKERQGVFARCYALSLYYVGYGGNHNSTTRFRRYDASGKAPAILTEYTDSAHLLRANHWYHIRITCEDSRICYYVDGQRLVDFRDSGPLRSGWFGFRTTLSHVRITNFRYSCTPWQPAEVPLHWVGTAPQSARPLTFGVPFDEGKVKADTPLSLTAAGAVDVPTDTWPLAYWPDGSVKWAAVAAVMPPAASGVTRKDVRPAVVNIGRKTKAAPAQTLVVRQSASQISVCTGPMTAYISRSGSALIDSLVCRDSLGQRQVCGSVDLVATTKTSPDPAAASAVTRYTSTLIPDSVEVERAGSVRTVVKVRGRYRSEAGREWLPFTVRLYFWAGSDEIRVVHSFVFDGDQSKDFIASMGVRCRVPLRDELYNRHIAFSTADGGVWSEPVQPLVGRRVLTLGHDKRPDNTLQRQQMRGVRIPPYSAFDEKNRSLLDQWAAWDGFRLSQLSADGYTVRKRASADCPWIGTLSGPRASGFAFAGDVSGGVGIQIKNFWESCPSSLEVEGARSDTATLTAYLWSPEAEPMDLRHYDTRAHGLEASYEDVQEGLSTPYGVARTSELTLVASAGYRGKADFAARAASAASESLLLPTPEYLHDRRAFGVWSLPDTTTAGRARVETRLDAYIGLYEKAVEQHRWYGFWHYGDFMHAYDPVRHCWRYDIGGFAWDNTELASPSWLWYGFLRSGRADIFRLASAMTRHCSEVDVYHIGPNAGLGSRHNVSHWGCGAKEARISAAGFSRFYYYLTADERTGDLMEAVKDADQKLYTLDPMRLAQPREQYPCTAPARLRIGPDWIAYAGNWLTQWERTRSTAYRDKILTGMKSIVALPNRIFTGPLALGYDPATGVISSECDSTLLSTNHLMTIMGGFEVMNELMAMLPYPQWEDAWLDFTTRYKQMAWTVRHNRFRISRLLAYSAFHTRSAATAAEAWQDLFTRIEHTEAPPFVISTVAPPEVPAAIDECPTVTTNDAALWSLDAIYMQETIPLN